MKLCFATNNKHKLEEVAKAFGDDLTIISLNELSVADDLPETQNTFYGNALQKAQFILDKFNIACFADDSGLQVDALNGDPGVYSARYAGPQRDSDDNIDLLLKNLKNTSQRQARFRTVIALVGLGTQQVFEGVIEGEITQSRIGKEGFGYDPVFRPTGSLKTFAEMTMEEKNSMSHRAIAVRKLIAYLKSIRH
jgi:XTP/dITP diphosphohydrolase